MSRERGGLRAKWAGLSFEAKVSAFVAPLLVFAVTFTAERLLGDRGGDETTETPEGSSGSGGLEVVALRASEGGTAGAIELVVRNTGESVSVITEAALTVRDVLHPAVIAGCEPPSDESGPEPSGGSFATNQGFVDVSGSYAVSIPAGDVIGGPLSVAVNQDIAPEDADRFAFAIGIEEDEASGSSPAVYLVDVAIDHDGGDEPLHAGSVLFGVPVFDPECAELTEDELEELEQLAETAEESPELAELLASRG